MLEKGFGLKETSKGGFLKRYAVKPENGNKCWHHSRLSGPTPFTECHSNLFALENYFLCPSVIIYCIFHINSLAKDNERKSSWNLLVVCLNEWF